MAGREESWHRNKPREEEAQRKIFCFLFHIFLKHFILLIRFATYGFSIKSTAAKTLVIWHAAMMMKVLGEFGTFL